MDDMNARTRSESLNKLDDLSLQIAMHIAKLASIPDSQESKHWIAELSAWSDKLAILNKGKKGRLNYNLDLLMSLIFEDYFEDEDALEVMKTKLKSKGYKIDTIDVNLAQTIAFKFADSVLTNKNFVG